MTTFFEPGRAYTTRTGYQAPEQAKSFACTAVTTMPAGERIAFGFLRTQAQDWTPTGLSTEHYDNDAWGPAPLPSWFTPAMALSPLTQADAAKRRRDIVGEVGALQDGHAALTSAPWYPARPGDLVHVHYEGHAGRAAHGETYIVGPAEHGLLSLQLLAHTLPEASGDSEVTGGWYATEDSDDPLADMWMEAGPDRLTVVRDGQVVHHGGLPVWPRTVMDLARTLGESERYLKRGDVGAALARLRSPGPLPPCGAPGMFPDDPDCARPRHHSGGHSPDPDLVDPPHQCPALPERVHAVVTVDSTADCVHFAGVYEDQATAADVAAGYGFGTAEHTEEFLTPAPGLPGEMSLRLPRRKQLAQSGVQLAVAVPLRVLPDPAAEDAWAEEGRATALSAEDCADDVDGEL